MKISFRAILAAALATGFVTLRAFAQEAAPTNAPVAASTNKPAVAVKKPAAQKQTVQSKGAVKPVAKKTEPKPEPVLHPEPGMAKQANVNIRGQAKINSEIVGRLKKGEAVTILEEVTLKKPKQDEPSHWFRIVLPPEAGVWVHSSFVDGNAVKANKLNLRGGPGEEYSILGRLEKGAPIKQIETKGDWMKIEAPTNATGFIAVHLLERTPMAIVAAPVAPKSNEVAVVPAAPPTTVPVTTDPAPVIAETPATPAVIPTPAATNPPAILPTVVPAAEEPLEKVKKIVSREGILKGSVSIQAPTYFELRSLDTGKTIDYVFSPSTNLMLKEFKGQRIIVTGEELLDERWQNTPVLIVDSIQTVP